MVLQKLRLSTVFIVSCLVVIGYSAEDEDHILKIHTTIDKNSAEQTKRFTGTGNNDEEGNADDDIDKRYVGRWKNYQYKTSRGNKRFIGMWRNPDYWMTDQLLNRAESRDKRNVGRWRNWNWMVSRLKSASDDDLHNDEKRFFGRWKNWNYLMSQRKAKDLDKRFVGRWLHRNYLLSNSGLDSEDDDAVDKRFLGRWKNRNYQTG